MKLPFRVATTLLPDLLVTLGVVVIVGAGGFEILRDAKESGR